MRLRPVSTLVLISALVLIPSAYTEAAAKTIVRVKEAANVRWGPGEDYEKVYTVPAPKYYPFELICEYNNWYVVVDYTGKIGWIYSPLVEKAPAVVIKVKQALARSGPGPEEPAIWNLGEGYSLKFLDKRGKWIHVEDAEGEKAWVYEDVLWGATE